MIASSYVRPLTSSVVQPSLVPASDTSSTQKSQSASSASAAQPALSSSTTGFTHPSRAITSARFGSALNIKTLVAAAERRETPLEAMQTIDGEIAQQLSMRRKHRDGVVPAYFDSGLYTQGHAGMLPEALRPKPARLSHSQRVFELETLVTSDAKDADIQGIIGEVPGIILRCVSRDEAAWLWLKRFSRVCMKMHQIVHKSVLTRPSITKVGDAFRSFLFFWNCVFFL